MKIRKAVLPVAGLGTRFLPLTKVVPKELLPLGDKPIVQHLVEEAIASGITEIIFVISRDKELIRDYFSPAPELEKMLKEKGKRELLKTIQSLPSLARFTFLIQEEPRGDGDAVLVAEKAVGHEPFLVLFGDEIVKSKVPASKQLLDHFQGESLLAVQRVPRSELQHYGVIAPGKRLGRRIEIKGLVEKPKPHLAPSSFGIVGKYVCTPALFSALKKSRPSQGKELRLIDGFRTLRETQALWAYEIQGDRFDTGKPEGLLLANLALRYNRPGRSATS